MQKKEEKKRKKNFCKAILPVLTASPSAKNKHPLQSNCFDSQSVKMCVWDGGALADLGALLARLVRLCLNEPLII